MADFVDKELDKFKEATKMEAEKIVKEVFPKRVLELDEMLKSDLFSITRLPNIHSELNIPVPDASMLNNTEEPQTKKRKMDLDMNHIGDVQGAKVLALPNGTAPCNHHITEIIEKLKPAVMELMDHANKVKMWITYLIPRIEDGNNFGVSIQEDTLGEARQVESEAATFLDQMTRYFIHRGKMVSKVAKYPHVADYRQVIRELDEKEFVTLRLVCCELRNQYATLHDVIVKNKEKIVKPRTTNTDAMY